MKQKKIYETPGVEITLLGMESIICTSGEAGSSIGNLQENDLSGLFV